jgi:hypothetical protein
LPLSVVSHSETLERANERLHNVMRPVNTFFNIRFYFVHCS